jgi:hypothetical protein
MSGGNDILDGWAQGTCSGTANSTAAQKCFGLLYGYIDTMIATILKTFPFVQIVQFGYDFVNFDYNDECKGTHIDFSIISMMDWMIDV